MSSPIITVGGFNLPASIGATVSAVYMPDVTALTGANSIASVVTVGLGLKTMILVNVSGNIISAWRILTGPADVTDPNNQVAPNDYNASTNNVAWVRGAGFGDSFLAGARVTNSAAISIPTATDTALTFDTVRYNGGEFSSTLPSRITISRAGVYNLSASIQFAANVTGQRTIKIRRNGSQVIASQTVYPSSAATTGTNLALATSFQCTTADYFELVVYQNSGGSLQVLKTDAYSPEFSAIWGGSTSVVGTSQDASSDSVIDSAVSAATTKSGNLVVPFSITDVGWYRFFAGSLPSGGQFRLQRLAQAAGTYGDFIIDFAVIGDLSTPNEGAITLLRNCTPTTTQTPIDTVRIAHVGTSSYVDVRLMQAGSWQFSRSASDTGGFVDAPYLIQTDSVNQFDQSLQYRVLGNVIGSTSNMDAAALRIGSRTTLVSPIYSGTWALWTGTADRTAKDTASATTADCAKAIKSILDDLAGSQGILKIFPAAGGLPANTYNSLWGLGILPNVPADIQAGATKSINNITKITAQTGGTATITGTYTAVDTLNAKSRYFMLGYQYKKGNNVACISYNGTIWEVYDNTGARQFHQQTGTTNPWDAATWLDQSNATQTVTFVAPNIVLTFADLSTTPHTAEQLSGSTAGYNGLYTLNGTLNGKNRYYLVGTGTNNKRIEWSGTQWLIKDDSATAFTSNETVTYPDQVVNGWTPASGSDVVAVDGISQFLLSSGFALYPSSNEVFLPQIGSNNVVGGRQLIYCDYATGNVAVCDGSFWKIYDTIALGSLIATSDTFAKFPWEASWATANYTMTTHKAFQPDAWT